MMQVENFHFWGMHFVWWFVWLLLIIWVFATPYYVPGQRKKNKMPLDVLKGRLAAGQISKEEYLDTKAALEA